MSVYTGGPVFIRATGSCKGHTKLRFPLLSGKSTVKSMVHWFFSNENLMPEDAPRSNASRKKTFVLLTTYNSLLTAFISL